MKTIIATIALLSVLTTAGAQPMCESTCTVYHTHPTQLYRALTLLKHLSVDFSTPVPVILETAGHIEFAHRYISPGPVGIATRIGVRCVPIGMALPAMTGTWAPTAAYPTPSMWIKGGKSGSNISSWDDHYGRTLLFTPPTQVGPGLCRVEVWGTSHTSANSVDGNAHVNIPAGDPVAAAADPYNFFTVKISPVP